MTSRLVAATVGFSMRFLRILAVSTACGPLRTGPVRLGVATDVLVRLGASQRDAMAAEAKLLDSIKQDLNAESAFENCAHLQEHLQLSDKAVRKIMCRHPSLLRSSWEQTIKPALQLMKAKCHLSQAELARIVERHPSILSYNIEPSLAALQRTLKLSSADLHRIVVGAPSALGLSFDDNVAPKLNGLRTLLDVRDEELRKIVVARPSLLGLCHETNVAPRLRALATRLELSTEELRRVVVRHPSLIGCSYESNLDPSMTALERRLGLSTAELKQVVTRLPQVLTYSFETNLAPKLDYLESELGMSPDELRLRVVALPAVLGYSLDGRYRPRVARCIEAGLPGAHAVHTIAYSEARFAASLRSGKADVKAARGANEDDGFAGRCDGEVDVDEFLGCVERGET